MGTAHGSLLKTYRLQSTHFEPGEKLWFHRGLIELNRWSYRFAWYEAVVRESTAEMQRSCLWVSWSKNFFGESCEVSEVGTMVALLLPL